MEQLGKILARSSNQGNTLDQKTSKADLSPFKSFVPVKGAEVALATFKALASGETLWKLLFAYGTTGNGKTHLCNALAETQGARTLDWSGMVRTLKRSMNPDNWGVTHYDEIFERMLKCPCLILDDVGSGSSSTDWAWRELEDIINHRYANNLMTVVTTNIDLKLVPARILSRFRDTEKSRLVFIEAPDYRPLKGRQ